MPQHCTDYLAEDVSSCPRRRLTFGLSRPTDWDKLAGDFLVKNMVFMLRVRGFMLKGASLLMCAMIACLYATPLGPEAEARKLQTAFTLLALFTACVGVLEYDLLASVRLTRLYELKHAYRS